MVQYVVETDRYYSSNYYGTQSRITDIFLNVIGASELLSSKPAPEIIASISHSNSALDILSPYRVVSFLILEASEFSRCRRFILWLIITTTLMVRA